MYYLYIIIDSNGCTNINDKYKYMDFLTMVWVQTKVKTKDCYKAQVICLAYSQYYSR